MVQMFFGGSATIFVMTFSFFVNVNKKCNFHFFGGFSEQKIQIQIRHHFLLIAVSGALELLCLGAGGSNIYLQCQ